MEYNKQLQIASKEKYINSIFDDLDISYNTRIEYIARIQLFFKFINTSGFNTRSYLLFKRYLECRLDYKIATKNKYMITARIFLRELVGRRLLPMDISRGIKLFKQNKLHKKQGLTDKEVQLLGIKLKYLPNTARNNRLRAIFSLLAFQGLRQIEVVRLDVADIDLKHKVGFIRGKGQDDKEMIYLAPATVIALKQYLKNFDSTNEALFYSIGNRISRRICTMTIKREMNYLFNNLGIEKSVHGFRHFYVTELLKNMDMRDVRKFSRHRSMEMLMVYDDELSICNKSQDVFRVLEKFNY